MSDYLAYWKKYWRDCQDTGQRFTEQWHTNSKRSFQQVKPDDNFWIVATGGSDCPDEWRLVQRLHINEVRLDSEHVRRYLFDGVVEERWKFDIGAQSDFTPILHKLDFASGKKIKERGKRIGLTLENIRRLSEDDVALLELRAKGMARV